ncbi:MAG: hypothetical protein U9Q06_03615, partial [Nanoarchaeota archaeon]|nr:hypothetical protein [Nanoarchaeota archaeon]
NSTWDSNAYKQFWYNQTLGTYNQYGSNWYNHTADTFTLYNSTWDNRGWVEAKGYLTAMINDGLTINYQNISNLPTCAGTDKLTYDGTTLSCANDVDTNTQKTTNEFYIYNDSTTIHFNETQLNATINAIAVTSESDPIFLNENASLWSEAENKYNASYAGSLNNASYLSTYNSTYDRWAYNQTLPAQNYADNNFLKLIGGSLTGQLNVTNGMTISGNMEINNGWTNGGVTISGGEIFLQTLYTYNLTSLGVNNLNINGSLLPIDWDNTFNVGNRTWQWKNGYFGTEVYIDGNAISPWMYNQTLGTYNQYGKWWYNQTLATYNQYGSNWYNHTADTFTLYNATWDNRGWVEAKGYLTAMINDGLTINYQNISNLPTCAGTDKLTYDGTTLSCANDVDTNTQKTTNEFYIYNDSTTIHFNETQLNATINAIAVTSESDPIFLNENASLWSEAENKYNASYAGSLNNASYLSTYNSTYSSFANNGVVIAGENITSGTITFARLPSLTDTHTLNIANITDFNYNYNQSLATYNMWDSRWLDGNLSWNETYADTLYSNIQWNYNQTLGTYNQYGKWWYNQTKPALDKIYWNLSNSQIIPYDSTIPVNITSTLFARTLNLTTSGGSTFDIGYIEVSDEGAWTNYTQISLSAFGDSATDGDLWFKGETGVNFNLFNYGSVCILNSSDDDASLCMNHNADEGMYIAGTESWQLLSGENLNQLYLKDDGNVGIGTDSPSHKLDVRGIGNFSGTIYLNNNTDISTWMYNQSLASYTQYGSNWYNHTLSTFTIYNATWDNSFMNVWNYNQTKPALDKIYWNLSNSQIIPYNLATPINITGDLFVEGNTNLSFETYIGDGTNYAKFIDYTDAGLPMIESYSDAMTGYLLTVTDIFGVVGVNDDPYILFTNAALDADMSITFDRGTDSLEFTDATGGYHFDENVNMTTSGGSTFDIGYIEVSDEGAWTNYTQISLASFGDSATDGDLWFKGETGANFNLFNYGSVCILNSSDDDASICMMHDTDYGMYIQGTESWQLLSGANLNQLYLQDDGKVGIGTDNPTHTLNVVGDINATGNIYKLGGTAVDYVFDDYFGTPTNQNYTGLIPLKDLKEYIEKNHHLPRYEPKKYVGQIEVGKMSEMNLEKIEELSLYILEQQTQIDSLKQLVCLDHPEAEICQ